MPGQGLSNRQLIEAQVGGNEMVEVTFACESVRRVAMS